MRNRAPVRKVQRAPIVENSLTLALISSRKRLFIHRRNARARAQSIWPFSRSVRKLRSPRASVSRLTSRNFKARAPRARRKREAPTRITIYTIARDHKATITLSAPRAPQRRRISVARLGKKAAARANECSFARRAHPSLSLSLSPLSLLSLSLALSLSRSLSRQTSN